ncbi:MAG: hypothetical protein ABJC12_10900 [Saprospiraceae bacterium]
MIPVKNLFLILATLCFIIVIGGGVYEHVVMVPTWSAAPPSSLSMFNGKYGINPAPFWMMIHPLTIVLLIVSLITNWNNNRRKSILFVLVSYFLVLVATAIFFVPELISITGTPYQDMVDPSLLKRASTWEILSLLRLVFITALGIILLNALTKSNSAVILEKVTTVPLNYENDSMGG